MAQREISSPEEAKQAVDGMKKIDKRVGGAYESKLNAISKDLDEVAKYSTDLAENVPGASKALARLSGSLEQLGERLKNEKNPDVIAALEPQYQKVGEILTAFYESLASHIKMKQGSKSLKSAAQATSAQLSNFRKSIYDSINNLESYMKKAEAAYESKEAENQYETIMKKKKN